MTVIKKTLLAAACVGTLLMAGSAFADTSSLIVTGNVSGICKFTGPSFFMTFGSLDPSATSPVQKVTPVTYKCTNGTLATSMSIDNTGNLSTATVNMMNGAYTLPVALAWTTDVTTMGQGFGGVAPISVDVTGTIAVADLNTAYAGAYSHTATLTLAP